MVGRHSQLLNSRRRLSVTELRTQPRTLPRTLAWSRATVAPPWVVVVLAGALALSTTLLVPSRAAAITKEEVITLSKLGIAEPEIIKAIEKDRTVFDLKIQDILALKKAGVKEDVIKFMLSTPEKYGATAGTPEQPVAGTPAVEPDAPAKSEEELRAEAERMRLEAEKRRRELEAAQESQRKAFADAQLVRAMELAEDRDFAAAIQQFQQFLDKGGFGPGTDEYYRARFGIAYALSKANLLQSAAKLLVDILLEGPDKQFFQTAFYELRRLRQEIIYSPPDLEELTRFYVGRFSQSFQDEYNYFLGEFFYDYNNFERALNYLDQVSNTSPDYPKALYLKGLVMVRNNLFKSAVETFQDAILVAERMGGNPQVEDDAWLALARIAYESGNYDGAIYYYRKLRKDSPKLATAFYESAWTYFVKGDYSRAIGTFQVLHSPFFDHFFFPELWILEATVYLNMCHYDYARDALAVWQKRVSVLTVPLKQFLEQQRTPKDHYQSFLKAVEDRRGTLLPAELTYPVLSNVEFYNLYRTIRQVEDELQKLERSQAALGPFGQDLREQLNQIRQSRLNEVGIKIQQILKGVDAELEEYGIKLKEIEVDLIDVATTSLSKEQEEILARKEREGVLRQIESFVRRGGSEAEIKAFIDKQRLLQDLKPDEIEALRAKKSVPEPIIEYLFQLTEEEETEGGAIAIVGADALEWPYEGEYWSDEVGGFRSFLREECGQ
jgi:tetratricopeptide (TPR) repeat protein